MSNCIIVNSTKHQYIQLYFVSRNKDKKVTEYMISCRDWEENDIINYIYVINLNIVNTYTRITDIPEKIYCDSYTESDFDRNVFIIINNIKRQYILIPRDDLPKNIFEHMIINYGWHNCDNPIFHFKCNIPNIEYATYVQLH